MATGPHEPSTSHERVLLAFFALTFAITWGCWIPLAVGVALHSIPGRALGYAGTFAPALVALALAFKRARAAGVRELLARLQPRAVAARWVAFALGFTIAVKLAAALLHRAITGAWPAFGSEPFWLMALGTLVSTPVQAGEELGWRGVALPHLATRLGLARASLLLGVVWALWHLPLFFVRGADSYGQSFPLYAIGVVAISAAIAMLYAAADAVPRRGEQHDGHRAHRLTGRSRRVFAPRAAHRLAHGGRAVGVHGAHPHVDGEDGAATHWYI